MISSNKQISNNRLSNFELLRIVAMFMIVAHHFSVHGQFAFSTDRITIPRLWIQFIQLGGKVGVNIFILISGYFLVHCSDIKINKILKLWIQMVFYSITIYIAFILFGLESFRIRAVAKCFLPITGGNWWFANTYFVLYILSPFINIFLKHLDKKTFQNLLITLFIMWCLIPTITNNSFESNSLLWFMFLYSVSAYIRLWHNKSNISLKFYHLLALGFVILTFSSTVFFNFLALKIPMFGVYGDRFYEMQQLPIFLISFFMFLGFKNLHINYNKLVNLTSSATFGVYLIHENPYLRHLFWINWFKNAKYSDTILIIPYSIGVISFVFVLCTCIEWIRIYAFENNYMNLIMKTESAIIRTINKFCFLDFFDKL